MLPCCLCALCADAVNNVRANATRVRIDFFIKPYFQNFLQKYDAVRQYPRIWDILHFFVMSGLFFQQIKQFGISVEVELAIVVVRKFDVGRKYPSPFVAVGIASLNGV